MQNEIYDLLKPKNMKKDKKSKKNNNEKCPICKREMITGPSIDRHHFVPKLKGGKVVTLLHVICHRKLHSVFSESEMAKYYNTSEKCLERDEISSFVKWVQKKDSEYMESHKEHNDKKNKRKGRK